MLLKTYRSQLGISAVQSMPLLLQKSPSTHLHVHYGGRLEAMQEILHPHEIYRQQ